ncbi:calcium-binding allergen Ole e 8-like [Andrographis paniculata]|uniref:calcium-binding allergen Ole e 8-like n=1 Tax=Andrographis paniculata TaxID=175694 RepID=UPI0021E6F210|nr:calcium-binding allergen Ole e 8-like [Andrographis paniculata]
MSSVSGSGSGSGRPSLYLQNMDQVRQVFHRFDADGDGRISSQELIGVLKALGSSSESDTSPEDVAKMMEAIDTAEAGHINLQEFAAFCSPDSDPYKPKSADAGGEKELREAFELYDRDQDGKISADELHQILTRLGETCSLQDCAGMIQAVDSSGDGFVSFDEFRKMMTTNKK